MLPDSQQRAACTRGTTSPSLRLPPDFISSVSHSFGKFHPASLGCQGEAEGQEQGLCTPRSRSPLTGAGDPHEALPITSRVPGHVGCPCSHPQNREICFNSCCQYRSATSRYPPVCCSLTRVCPVPLMQILEGSCLWC